jgi:hypothetical protein
MSTTVKVRNQRPSAVRPLTKSIIHRSLERVAVKAGTRARLASFFRLAAMLAWLASATG